MTDIDQGGILVAGLFALKKIIADVSGRDLLDGFIDADEETGQYALVELERTFCFFLHGFGSQEHFECFRHATLDDGQGGFLVGDFEAGGDRVQAGKDQGSGVIVQEVLELFDQLGFEDFVVVHGRYSFF